MIADDDVDIHITFDTEGAAHKADGKAPVFSLAANAGDEDAIAMAIVEFVDGHCPLDGAMLLAMHESMPIKKGGEKFLIEANKDKSYVMTIKV